MKARRLLPQPHLPPTHHLPVAPPHYPIPQAPRLCHARGGRNGTGTTGVGERCLLPHHRLYTTPARFLAIRPYRQPTHHLLPRMQRPPAVCHVRPSNHPPPHTYLRLPLPLRMPHTRTLPRRRTVAVVVPNAPAYCRAAIFARLVVAYRLPHTTGVLLPRIIVHTDGTLTPPNYRQADQLPQPHPQYTCCVLFCGTPSPHCRPCCLLARTFITTLHATFAILNVNHLGQT